MKKSTKEIERLITAKGKRTVARSLAASIDEVEPNAENLPVHRRIPPNMGATEKDQAIIDKIAARAFKSVKKARGKHMERDALDYEMDITAVHLNGCPLHLADLLKGDDFNFAHDIAGIERFLNRESGKLTRGFLPRFAQKQGA